MVIPHTLGTLLRDAIFLTVAGLLLYWVEVPMVTKGLTSPDNLKDTVVWIIFLVTAVATVFAAVFVAEALFIVPYQIWQEAKHKLVGTHPDADAEIAFWIEKTKAGIETVKSPIVATSHSTPGSAEKQAPDQPRVA